MKAISDLVKISNLVSGGFPYNQILNEPAARRFVAIEKKERLDLVDYMFKLGYPEKLSAAYLNFLTRYCQEFLDEAAASFSSFVRLQYIHYELLCSQKEQIYDVVTKPHKYAREFPSSIHLETRSLCTASCTFCPYTDLERKGDIMPWSLIEKLSKEIATFPPDHSFSLSPFKVSDPFLDKRLPRICELILKSHQNVKIAITTNGYHLPEAMLDDVLKISSLFPGRIVLTISLNTVEKSKYQELMKLDFQKTLNNIMLIGRRRRDFASAGIPCVNLSRISTDAHGDIRFSKFVDDLNTSFQENFFKTEIGLLQDWIDDADITGESVGSSVMGRYACTEWERITILPDGSASLCCMTYNSTPGLPNFNLATIQEIYQAKLKKYAPLVHVNNNTFFVGRERSVEPCKSCQFGKSPQLSFLIQQLSDEDKRLFSSPDM